MSNTNELINETSPYLLQHAHNPVNWFSWGEKALNKAKTEDKPIFLSIGYSTCHWCHVMAHESFEDELVADVLNRNFISIKVDREQRPDIDSVYMSACQAMTGSGGWPTSIFMASDGKPFYAGTYFPKDSFLGLLEAVNKAWKNDRAALLESCERITKAITPTNESEYDLVDAPIEEAAENFKKTFDKEYGGFGSAPKFPSPHNLMFLLHTAPDIAEKTLIQMYRGGIFDHIGGGFSRYSTDRYWLAPHFEKMLYDNALLAIAYLMAYETTGNELYKTVVERIFSYLELEMNDKNGGFYSAQDADSDGEEGKYYLFTPNELISLLGKDDGTSFCSYYGVSAKGNFEGQNIPNLLHEPSPDPKITALLPKVYEYRQSRTSLHKDAKILTGWNALLAAAYAMAARILKNENYLNVAKKITSFIESDLTDNDEVFSGMGGGKRFGLGFLDDYAFYIFSLIQMHQATQEDSYLLRASQLTEKTIADYWSEGDGGFFFSGRKNEDLIFRPKESWDGAIPSGNSMMMYNLLRLSMLCENEKFGEWAEKQRRFMSAQASNYPTGYAFYLYSVLPITKVVCALGDKSDLNKFSIKSDWAFRVTNSTDYPIVNGKTTFYICSGGTCLPPTNEIP